MKLLIQERNNNLIWKDVIYKDGHFRASDESAVYDNWNIHAIKDDDRNKIVVCSACGKEVPNTPSSIKAHRNMVNKSNKCFDCRHLRHRNEKITSQKYVLNEDGTYSESTKRNVTLGCGYSYRTPDINSTEAKRWCRYAACENATFNPIKDFWTKNPDAFNEFITADRIMDVGYKSMYKYADHIVFELKCKAQINALVNNQGICFNFVLNYRNHTYSLRYSKKYDKVWFNDGGVFKELSRLDMAESTEKSIMDKLRKLYE